METQLVPASAPVYHRVLHPALTDALVLIGNHYHDWQVSMINDFETWTSPSVFGREACDLFLCKDGFARFAYHEIYELLEKTPVMVYPASLILNPYAFVNSSQTQINLALVTRQAYERVKSVNQYIR